VSAPGLVARNTEIIQRAADVKGRSLWVDARRRMMRNRAAVVSVVLLATVALVAVFVPMIWPYSYEQIDYGNILCAPSWWPDRSVSCFAGGFHIFGTEQNGRDLFIRVLYGARISLAVGLVATMVSLLIGVGYGAIAGFVGGKLDELMMRFVDVLYALPYIFLVIILMVVFNQNFFLLFVAIGAVEWLTMARIVRGQTLSIKEKEFVEAARAAGLSPLKNIRQHIVPNILGPVVVYVTLTIPTVILSESFLSFLGLGIREPLTSWGVLISDGAAHLETAPWMLIFPAAIMAITLFCFNFIGDGLRDALDPKDR